MNIVIIGSSAASKSAVETLRSKSAHSLKITVITHDKKYYYSRVLLPNFISEELAEEALYFVDSKFLSDKRIRIINGKAKSIDPLDKTVEVQGYGYVNYDKLIITTGASPSKLEVSHSDISGMYYLRNFEDALAIKKKAAIINHCVVLGGGLVSLKAAWALKKIGKNVTVIVSSNQVLSQVADQYSSKIAKEVFEENGVNIVLDALVEEFIDDHGSISYVKLKDGNIMPCEMVIIGKGVKPNIEITKNTEIEVCQGIIVNKRMKTSVKDIYAAGDVVECNSLLQDDKCTYTLWPDAVHQGRIAACNILGIDREYVGGMNMNSVSFYGTHFISMGIIRERDTKDYDVHYKYDPLKRIYKKIILKDDKLVGAILVGDISFAGMIYWDIKSKKSVNNPSMYLSKSGLEDIYLSRNSQIV